MLTIHDKASTRASSLARDLGIGHLIRAVLSARLHDKPVVAAGSTISPQARTARQRTVVKPLPVFQ
jgi:hypothetical protein